MKRLFTVLFFSGSMFFTAQAQDFQMPAASPSVSIEQAFSTSSIKLEYSRPSVKDRKIFGELIPFGQVWRTGANATSKITFKEPVFVDGQEVKPGVYSIYTIPDKEYWVIALNTDLDNWGAAGYDAKKNVVEVRAMVKRNPVTQETFSITLEDMTKESANLVIAWEHVRVEVPIVDKNQDRIVKHLEKALSGENPPYAQAAGYFLEKNIELEKASEYIQKAIDQNRSAYYLYWTQAQILEKLGKKDEALRAAETAATMARKSSPAFAHEYERNFKMMSNRLKR